MIQHLDTDISCHPGGSTGQQASWAASPEVMSAKSEADQPLSPGPQTARKDGREVYKNKGWSNPEKPVLIQACKAMPTFSPPPPPDWISSGFPTVLNNKNTNEHKSSNWNYDSGRGAWVIPLKSLPPFSHTLFLVFLPVSTALCTFQWENTPPPHPPFPHSTLQL